MWQDSLRNSHSVYETAGNLFHGNSLLGCTPNYRQRQEEKRGEELKATKIKIPVAPLNHSQVQNKPARKGTTSAPTGAPEVSRRVKPTQHTPVQRYPSMGFLPFNICSGDQIANCISWKHPTNKPSLYQHENTHLVPKDLPQTGSWVTRVSATGPSLWQQAAPTDRGEFVHRWPQNTARRRDFTISLGFDLNRPTTVCPQQKHALFEPRLYLLHEISCYWSLYQE